MNSGFRSQAVSDALTQRQLHVERAKTELHSEHDAVSSAVIAALITGLGKLNTQKFGSISRTALRVIVKRVLDSYDLEILRYEEQMLNWLELYSNEEAEFLSTVMNAAIEEEQTIPPVWPFVVGAIIGATGLNSPQTLAGLRATQRNAIKKTIQRAFAQNWSVGQVITAFRGTILRGFRDGLMPKLRRAAAATVDTVVQHGMSAARFQTLQSYLNWTLGYTWVSILDGKTSQTCRSLSGRVFSFGTGPLPPIHYRCRSHIEPIFKLTSVLSQTASGVLKTGETYYTWLRAQPRVFQDEVLGNSWGKLFRSGGLSSDEFAARVINARYEPLTLEQLRKKSPVMFNRANV